MARQGDCVENPVTGERVTFLQTSQDTSGELLRWEWSLQPDGFLPGAAHTHPHQEERFEVLSGTLGARIGRRRHKLIAGETAVVPPGEIHGWWNEGDEGVRVLVGLRPALDTEGFFETVFGLARDGSVNNKGVPGVLQVVALLDEYEEEMGIPYVPGWLQRAVVSLLAPLARRRGYRGRYPKGGKRRRLSHSTA